VVFLDDYRWHTPEQVDITYTVAGLGSRFLALLIDMIIQGLILWLLIASLLSSLGTAGEGYLALFIVVCAVVYAGYFFIFELAMKGRTPGKALMKIRVVRMDGRAADTSGILLRNLVRLIDFLPAFYTVGVITMFIHKQSRRLGDLAAGTIVIVERKQTTLNMILAEQRSVVNTALSNQEYTVIRDFFARKNELTKKSRARLATAIAAPLYDHWQATEEERRDPERFLYRVLHEEFRQN